jgi:hypothetical protein
VLSCSSRAIFSVFLSCFDFSKISKRRCMCPPCVCVCARAYTPVCVYVGVRACVRARAT